MGLIIYKDRDHYNDFSLCCALSSRHYLSTQSFNHSSVTNDMWPIELLRSPKCVLLQDSTVAFQCFQCKSVNKCKQDYVVFTELHCPQ